VLSPRPWTWKPSHPLADMKTGRYRVVCGDDGPELIR
jgi:hypothetical protein